MSGYVYDAVPCGTCGKEAPGTKRCANCWEVERRLRDYLRSRAGQRFVADALREAVL